MAASEKTSVERQTGRAYRRELAAAAAGYAVVLLAVVLAVDFDTAGDWKYAAALLPVVPASLGAVAIARHLGRVDEMQRSLLLDGMAAGFGLTMMASITIGILAIAGLDLGRSAPWVIYSLGMLTWLLVSAREARTHG